MVIQDFKVVLKRLTEDDIAIFKRNLRPSNAVVNVSSSTTTINIVSCSLPVTFKEITEIIGVDTFEYCQSKNPILGIDNFKNNKEEENEKHLVPINDTKDHITQNDLKTQETIAADTHSADNITLPVLKSIKNKRSTEKFPRGMNIWII